MLWVVVSSWKGIPDGIRSFPAAAPASCYSGMHNALKKRLHQIFTPPINRTQWREIRPLMEKVIADSLDFKQQKNRTISNLARQYSPCYILWKSSRCYCLIWFTKSFFYIIPKRVFIQTDTGTAHQYTGLYIIYTKTLISAVTVFVNFTLMSNSGAKLMQTWNLYTKAGLKVSNYGS